LNNEKLKIKNAKTDPAGAGLHFLILN